ncbi:MAG: hypothetical protein ACLT98_12490 [Eggerthellaceae bacterium]
MMDEYGADAGASMFMASRQGPRLERGGSWRIYRFLNRVWRIAYDLMGEAGDDVLPGRRCDPEQAAEPRRSCCASVIVLWVTDDSCNNFNTAIAAIMGWSMLQVITCAKLPRSARCRARPRCGRTIVAACSDVRVFRRAVAYASRSRDQRPWRRGRRSILRWRRPRSELAVQIDGKVKSASRLPPMRMRLQSSGCPMPAMRSKARTW